MHFVPINFSNPGFNPTYTADFQLIVIVNGENFSYAVGHPVTQLLIRVSTNRPLQELFDPKNQEAFSASKYQKVTVAAESNSFCLIPDAIFTPENLANYAAFLSVKEADLILTDQLSNGENTVIFTLPETLVKQMDSQYPSAKIQFAPKSWIKMVLEEKVSSQNLYLFLEENRLKILFLSQENIRFYNQFDYSNPDELVYFTALVADQLKLKPEETRLIFCGSVEAESEPMLRLQDFFKDVKPFTGSYFGRKNSLQQHQITQFLGFS